MQEKSIPHTNKRLGTRYQLEVKELGPNFYEILYNDPLDTRYTTGTKIKTRINPKGEHEIVEFIKSEYITQRYLLDIAQNINDLQVLVEELYKYGGSFQLDMGGMASVNIPANFSYKLEKVIEDYGIKASRI